MASDDLIVTQPNPMSDKSSKSIVSRPGSELTRTRPGAAAIIDRMIGDVTGVMSGSREKRGAGGRRQCGGTGLSQVSKMKNQVK